MPDLVGSKNTRDRVNIKADVQTAKGLVKVKVPFVMGVMSELSGAGADQLSSVADRQFLDFNQQNFNKRIESIAPTIRCEVKNMLANDGSTLPVELKIKTMHDFTPGGVAKQVEPLRRLMLVRNKLKEILANAQGHTDREKAVMALLSKMQNDPAAKAALDKINK